MLIKFQTFTLPVLIQNKFMPAVINNIRKRASSQLASIYRRKIENIFNLFFFSLHPRGLFRRAFRIGALWLCGFSTQFHKHSNAGAFD